MYWKIERLSGHRHGVFDAADRRFLSYASLLEQAGTLEESLRTGSKSLVALMCDNSLASLIGYLSALRAGHAVMLTNATTEESLKQRLIDTYAPEIVLSVARHSESHLGYETGPSPISGLALYRAKRPSNAKINPETAILLSTSGTTGSPRAIRLSYDNVQSNAESIRQYLAISPDDSAITTLPMSYSYGLSVVNSHLLAGANIVCTNSSLVTPDFWGLFKDRKCSSFAGVPFSYEMLDRLQFGRMELPYLRTMTQAGGRLAPEKIRLFADIARQKRMRFFVMYGQTEASPRISYVPYERVHDKIGSVGIAIPGGTLRLDMDGMEVLEANITAELVYQGPNVMLGYADTRDCLGKGDEMNGRLRTGDVGHRDAEGFYYITGRLKRFIKVFGLRLNLDEVEKMLESSLARPVACVGKDDLLHLVVESNEKSDAAEAKRRVVKLYKLHHSVVHAHHTPLLPLNASGKKDYVTAARGLD